MAKGLYWRMHEGERVNLLDNVDYVRFGLRGYPVIFRGRVNFLESIRKVRATLE
jgi:hypothetical protein